jgi:hypothetical protein
MPDLSVPPRTDATSRGARRIGNGRRAAVAALTIALGAAAGPHAVAQSPVQFQGIADAEFWSTSGESRLLSRDEDRPSGLGRIALWGAAEPVSGLVFFAEGQAEGGPAHIGVHQYRLEADQFGVRYARSPLLVVDVGRLVPVIGTFAARRFSTRNPLIGVPDGYPLVYPGGAEVSGEGRHFDYRAALVTLPVSHPGYQPTPTARLRPAVGFGVTPFTGFRLGGSFTAGSYLNDDLPATELNGQTWSSYQQRVVAFDLAFARGYLETHAEAARGSYDVPGRAEAVGWTYYGEAKYTFGPRFFVATRIERNEYPFIAPAPPSWNVQLNDFVDGEAGVGYRLTANTLLKASIRSDRWWPPGVQPMYGTGRPDGRAIALQWSQAFDVLR